MLLVALLFVGTENKKERMNSLIQTAQGRISRWS